MNINYVSIGNKSNSLLKENIDKGLNYLRSYSINVFTDIPDIYPYSTIYKIINKYDNGLQNSRYVKTNLYSYTKSEFNLYLDVDTIVMNNGIKLFKEILLDGFDFVICPSNNQADNSFWHISNTEREYTFNQIGYLSLQLQCGVFAYRKNEIVDKFFKSWYAEWMKFEQHDQAAFVRALHNNPISYYVLGNSWNGGTIIRHDFGKLR